MDFKFGKKIKSLRNEKGITQEKLAEVLNLRIGTIGTYEIDKSQPSHIVLYNIANYFEVSMDEIYNDSKV